MLPPNARYLKKRRIITDRKCPAQHRCLYQMLNLRKPNNPPQLPSFVNGVCRGGSAQQIVPLGLIIFTIGWQRSGSKSTIVLHNLNRSSNRSYIWGITTPNRSHLSNHPNRLYRVVFSRSFSLRFSSQSPNFPLSTQSFCFCYSS